MTALDLYRAEAAGHFHGKLSIAADHSGFHFRVLSILCYLYDSVIRILTVDTQGCFSGIVRCILFHGIGHGYCISISLYLQMQCCIGIEVAFCHNQCLIVIVFLCGSNGCGPFLILCFQHFITGNITEIIIRPHTVIAILLRYFRNLVCRQIIPVTAFIGSHFYTIRLEGNGKL